MSAHEEFHAVKIQNRRIEVKKLINVLLLGLAFFLLGSTPALADGPKHALAKAGKAVVKTIAATPKAAAVSIKDTIGGVLFAAEAVVDVVHAGTTGLAKAGSTELKHNPFVYADKAVAKADTDLEKAYLFFFHASI